VIKKEWQEGSTFQYGDLTRVELHGLAEELEKLKRPLAHINPAWFALEAARSKNYKVKS